MKHLHRMWRYKRDGFAIQKSPGSQVRRPADAIKKEDAPEPEGGHGRNRYAKSRCGDGATDAGQQGKDASNQGDASYQESDLGSCRAEPVGHQ